MKDETLEKKIKKSMRKKLSKSRDFLLINNEDSEYFLINEAGTSVEKLFQAYGSVKWSPSGENIFFSDDNTMYSYSIKNKKKDIFREFPGTDGVWLRGVLNDDQIIATVMRRLSNEDYEHSLIIFNREWPIDVIYKSKKNMPFVNSYSLDGKIIYGDLYHNWLLDLNKNESEILIKKNYLISPKGDGIFYVDDDRRRIILEYLSTGITEEFHISLKNKVLEEKLSRLDNKLKKYRRIFGKKFVERLIKIKLHQKSDRTWSGSIYPIAVSTHLKSLLYIDFSCREAGDGFLIKISPFKTYELEGKNHVLDPTGTKVACIFKDDPNEHPYDMWRTQLGIYYLDDSGKITLKKSMPIPYLYDVVGWQPKSIYY